MVSKLRAESTAMAREQDSFILLVGLVHQHDECQLLIILYGCFATVTGLFLHFDVET